MSEYLQDTRRIGKRDVEVVASHVKHLKSIYRHHRQGFSNDRERTIRHVASIPKWVIFDPEYKKYLDINQDTLERSKGIDALLDRLNRDGVNFRI